MDIHQYQVGQRGQRTRHALLAVVGAQHLHAHALEQRAHQHAVVGAVFHHQHPAGQLRRCAVERCRRRRLGNHGPGRLDRDRHDGAHARSALDRHAAAHGTGQLVHQVQPQAGAAKAPGHAAVGLVERCEQRGHLLRIHADAGVAHAAIQQLVLLVVPERHLDPALLGELDGVRDQVEQDLPPARGVAQHLRRHGGAQFGGIGDGALPRRPAHQRRHGVEHFRRHKRQSFEHQFARLHLGHIEHVVHQLQQVLAVAGDDSSQLTGWRGPLLRQLFGKADDRGERRADFVAHHGQEDRFGRVGLVGGHLERALLAQGQVALVHGAPDRHAGGQHRQAAHGTHQPQLPGKIAPLFEEDLLRDGDLDHQRTIRNHPFGSQRPGAGDAWRRLHLVIHRRAGEAQLAFDVFVAAHVAGDGTEHGVLCRPARQHRTVAPEQGDRALPVQLDLAVKAADLPARYPHQHHADKAAIGRRDAAREIERPGAVALVAHRRADVQAQVRARVVGLEVVAFGQVDRRCRKAAREVDDLAVRRDDAGNVDLWQHPVALHQSLELFPAAQTAAQIGAIAYTDQAYALEHAVEYQVGGAHLVRGLLRQQQGRAIELLAPGLDFAVPGAV
ncbi:hypothetical protein DUPY_06510 [Duganella phyllosphaerae]|uniref:Uncharacterized protein n=1 Tax=Duganella phyllosphaerae TaxID=762836 RepID=A0A1E7X6B8_9BURK|nr:hypothetical protein DUPY_06510 [Duganella phyllosphaerae]